MIDHKDEAKFALEKSEGRAEFESALVDAQRAQVHATLYLAEQQAAATEQARITNILMYHSIAAQIDLGQLGGEIQNTIKKGMGLA